MRFLATLALFAAVVKVQADEQAAQNWLTTWLNPNYKSTPALPHDESSKSCPRCFKGYLNNKNW
jgi:hypothetical protein